MADVSPGGPPDPGATPPAPHVPGGALPATSAPVTGPVLEPSVAGGYQPLPVPATAVLDARVDPATGRPRTGWRRWLPISLLILLLLAGAIGMLLFLGVNYGGVALAVGLTAAVIPVPLLVSAFLWLDRYEPEPIRYLAFSFAWGAAIATSVALAVNTGASALFDKLGLPDALVAVLVAPFIEESMKAAGPILLFWRRREEWSGITDGIVYAGLSALGFAMVENVLYLGGHGYAAGAHQYGTASGLQNVFAIFIVRILFTGFAHPLFTSMTGIGLGIAARSGDRRVRWLAPIAGLLLAMMLHGTFNLLPTLSVSLSQPFIMLYGYLGFMVPFFFAVVGFAIALRGWEGRIAERILPFYVRTGWFAPPEVAALGSLGRRYSARQWARRVAGPAGQRAMKGFQFAATQLALLRDGMQRGLHRTSASMRRAELEEQRLLAAIVDYRSTFAGRDPQSPQAFWNGHLYQIAFPDGVTRPIAAPDEPVVPVPIRFAAPAYAAYGPSYGGYPYAAGNPGYHTPPYGAAGYGSPPPGAAAYGPPPAGHGGTGYGAAPAASTTYGGGGYGVPPAGPTNYGVGGYGAGAAGSTAYGAGGYGAPPAGSAGYGVGGAAQAGSGGYGTAGAAPAGSPDYSQTGAPPTASGSYGQAGYGAAPGSGGYGQGGYGAAPPGSGSYGQAGYGGVPTGSGSHGQGSYGAAQTGSGSYGQAGYGGASTGSGSYGEGGYGAASAGSGSYGEGGYGAASAGSGSYGRDAPSSSAATPGSGDFGTPPAGHLGASPWSAPPAHGAPAYEMRPEPSRPASPATGDEQPKPGTPPAE